MNPTRVRNRRRVRANLDQIIPALDALNSGTATYQANGSATGLVPMGALAGPQAGATSTPTRLSPTAGGSVAGTICSVVPSASPDMVVYAVADFGSPPIMFATV